MLSDSAVKNPPANAGDAGSIPSLERSSGERNGNKLQYSCLEESHGERSLVGYSLWGHRESDMKRWQEYTEELYKKDLHDPDNHNGVITHVQPDIPE